ncbi:hypothetical protein PV327_011114 [Microctonus hyperodae]|uniref:Exonuclease domain-containing protein n=1 Tax=Microctonus hyperodae TaxID=165561 RepID=A0AA39EYT1_MICHY|nr:hypothetical protein PV327_011114 [Microctonus hyperodae]
MGKLLDYCTKNRQCIFCTHKEKNGRTIEHDCRSNYFGSAKSLEAAGAVQLTVKSKILQENNAEVGIFIGDNDSSSMSAIQEASDHTILKQSDMNNTKKRNTFTTIIKKNVGNTHEIEKSLKNLPYHVFDKHDHCGSICVYHEDKENYDSSRHFKNEVLFYALKNLFDKLAQNAADYSLAGSSQANETLNNSMSSHCPKSRSYSTTESSDFRFAVTVAHKNLDEGFSVNTMDEAGIKYSSSLLKYIKTTDSKATKRKHSEEQPQQKAKRKVEASQKKQLRMRKEHSEIATYASNLALFGNSSNCNFISTTSDNISYNTDNIAFVFFDLETGGYKVGKDILQIAMKNENLCFNIYITPRQLVDASASTVHGLTYKDKQVYLNGKGMSSVTRKFAFSKTIEFLKSLKKKLILIAHNCLFDTRHFMHAVTQLLQIEALCDIIIEFSDSLPLFKLKLPNRPNKYSLAVLGEKLLQTSMSSAHNALFDVEVLEKLC